ncbi:MAG: hypothetical protein J6Y79_05000 [Paludibacteraceae bacterium]|nr:hypothetical protein [Paludibacteraceae bacterium]
MEEKHPDACILKLLMAGHEEELLIYMTLFTIRNGCPLKIKGMKAYEGLTF